MASREVTAANIVNQFPALIRGRHPPRLPRHAVHPVVRLRPRPQLHELRLLYTADTATGVTLPAQQLIGFAQLMETRVCKDVTTSKANASASVARRFRTRSERLSVSWPQIFPNGTAQPNPQALRSRLPPPGRRSHGPMLLRVTVLRLTLAVSRPVNDQLDLAHTFSSPVGGLAIPRPGPTVLQTAHIQR